MQSERQKSKKKICSTKRKFYKKLSTAHPSPRHPVIFNVSDFRGRVQFIIKVLIIILFILLIKQTLSFLAQQMKMTGDAVTHEKRPPYLCIAIQRAMEAIGSS
jgi:hypothetical protein